MPESPRYDYICDACGDRVTIEDAPVDDDSGWECSKCGRYVSLRRTGWRPIIARFIITGSTQR